MVKTKEISYKRGPYKKNQDETPSSSSNSSGLYRSKIKRKVPHLEKSIDCQELYQYLFTVKFELKQKFAPSYNRSLIIENIQALMDKFNKQVLKTQLKDEEHLVQRIAELEQLLAEKVSPDTSDKNVPDL